MASLGARGRSRSVLRPVGRSRTRVASLMMLLSWLSMSVVVVGVMMRGRLLRKGSQLKRKSHRRCVLFDCVAAVNSAMGRGRAGRKLNRHRGRGSGGEALDSQSNDNTGATPTTKHNEFSKCIYKRLVRLNFIGCSSTHEEYDSISATIAYSSFLISDDAGPTNDASSSNDSCSIGDLAPYPSNEEINVAARTLVEYFDELSFKDAEELIRDAALDAWDKKKNVGQSSCDVEGENNINANDEIHDEDEDDDHDDDDGEYIGEGECELCERSVKLTRHHLVPKSTWPKMKKRLWSAASIIEELEQHSLQLRDVSYYARGLEERLLLRKQLDKILGDRFDITYLPTTITNDTIRNYLARVCHLCRQCHSAVHRIHSSEWELATEYNTMERLLECKEILKYGAWASKQRCGRLTK